MVQRERLEPSGPRCISIALIHCPSCVNANEERQKIMSGKGCFQHYIDTCYSFLSTGWVWGPRRKWSPWTNGEQRCTLLPQHGNQICCSIWNWVEHVLLTQGPRGLPGERGRPGPSGVAVSVILFSFDTCIQPERLELANFSCADLFRVPVVTMAWPVLPVPQ